MRVTKTVESTWGYAAASQSRQKEQCEIRGGLERWNLMWFVCGRPFVLSLTLSLYVFLPLSSSLYSFTPYLSHLRITIYFLIWIKKWIFCWVYVNKSLNKFLLTFIMSFFIFFFTGLKEGWPLKFPTCVRTFNKNPFFQVLHM